MRVVVTGANRGLGLEFARQLLARGDRVFATCRQPGAAGALQALAADHPQNLTITALDVADPDSIDAAYADIQPQTAALDLLINNAGMSPGGTERLGRFEQDLMLRTLAINAVGPMLVVQRFLDLVKAGDRPKIVNITSGLGSLTNRNGGGAYSYSASKAALNMYTRTLMFDVKKHGIITIVMDPGWVKTDMGGSNAWITPEVSIGGMLAVIDGLTPEHSGRFFLYDGAEIPW
jgi:NAD(P)-dependent dehydrogenase (short-subunit alcohol dehydrogenase family)